MPRRRLHHAHERRDTVVDGQHRRRAHERRLEAFVKAAALEMPRRLRINVVSPGWVTETLHKLGLDPSGGTPARDVVRAYVTAVEGTMQGETIRPRRSDANP